MNVQRPTASPDLIAAMIESAPERVRGRLDRTPVAAVSWIWQPCDEGWTVHTGTETVTLPFGHAAVIEQLNCTCLLSPRCFHVLACLMCLDVASVDSAPPEPTAEVELPARDEIDDLAEPDERQRRSARELVRSVAQILQVGVANAGIVVQSGVLRAVHQCRAEGLYRLAALGLKVVAGTSEFRARALTSDPGQLADDMADLLETGRRVLREGAIAGFWIGTARRKQRPVHPRRLHGVLAEPIITRSGFSGAAAYFLGEDDRIYSAADVRPGDPAHARNAYLGGMEIGAMIQPAKQLARSLYFGTDFTASSDGRLGRGKDTRIVEQGPSTWQAGPIRERFQRSLSDQRDRIYAAAALPVDARPAGWDLVFVAGTIKGASGAELVFRVESDPRPIRLAIENESETLYFRENLRMLSHAPGLRLKLIARVNLHDPTTLSPLALAPSDDDRTGDDEPRLEIPPTLAGRICLGFDEIQRHFLINAQAAPVVVGAPSWADDTDNPLDPLKRRWIATLLSGLDSRRTGNAKMLSAEATALRRLGFVTGAALLETLSSPRLDIRSDGLDLFLAIAIYLRTCAQELGRSRASLEAE